MLTARVNLMKLVLINPNIKHMEIIIANVDREKR